MKPFHRVLHPQIKIVDAAKGIVDYIASDETIDCYKEVIRATGWRFTNFRKNAPFVDSHDYYTIANQVGKVIDYNVDNGQLIERVQWAIDVPENKLAQLGWSMTEKGYLKAVSVGFFPTKAVTKWDSDPTGWKQQLKEIGKHEEDGVRVIYVEQEQIELSTCVIGANPNALAKAYKDGVVNDADLDWISQEQAKIESVRSAAGLAHAEWTQERAKEAFLREFETLVKQITH